MSVISFSKLWFIRQYGQMEKQRWEESERRSQEVRRSEKRKSEKKEEAGARKGRKVAIHCVYPMICGSGGSKSRLAKAAGAEPSGQMRDKKLHAVVAGSTFVHKKANYFTSSDPHHDISKQAFYLAFLSGILIWHSSLAFFLAFHLAFLSGTLSDVLSGILSGISFGILSGGWGPAENNGRGWSRLRSGREHLA